MEETIAFSSAARSFPQPFAGFDTTSAADASFVAHLDPSLGGFPNAAFNSQFANHFGGDHGQSVSSAAAITQSNGIPGSYHEVQAQSMHSTPQQHGQPPQKRSRGRRQHSTLELNGTTANNSFIHSPPVQRIENENDAAGRLSTKSSGEKKEASHFSGMKKVLQPPDLERWREKLFNVDETVVMTEEE